MASSPQGGIVKRPSPALVIACVALFASLGGTGYAATQIHSGGVAASKKAVKALTKNDVNKLIASYVKAHHIGATGPQGPQGPAGGTGLEGKIGPKGPDASPLYEEITGEAPYKSVATVGLWTISLACEKGPVAAVKLTGPGSVYMTVSLGGIDGEAKTYTDSGPLGSGSVSGAAGTAQMSLSGFLRSGSTMAQFSLQMTVIEGGLFNKCTLLGDTIPVSS